MALNTVVDTPADSGVPVYRDSFLRTDYLARNPAQEPLLMKLRVAIDELVWHPHDPQQWLTYQFSGSCDRPMPEVARRALRT